MYSFAIVQICLVFFGAVSVFGGCSIKPIDGVVKIPVGTTSIEANAFYDCEELTVVIMHKRVTKVEYNAFDDAKNLETVIFEKGSLLTEIGDYAFRGCRNLKTINIPSGIETLGWDAFKNTGCDENTFIPGRIVFDCIYYTGETGTKTLRKKGGD
mmetsp:Transcript_38520/g.75221  ORF Transcript_38520/g.75221 Transcript_38520/m.75221 type:complete len:155 (+) Transcript_38520:41-505(+)